MGMDAGMDQMRLVLASASPRRRELLRGLGLFFSVRPADIDETPGESEAPAQYVRRLAVEKAEARAATGTVVIAADTVVVIDSQILGKPNDRAHAAATLCALADRTHEVYTGVAVLAEPGDTEPHGAERRRASGVEITRVTMAEIPPGRIDSFLDVGEYADKAGSYALLGSSSIFADHVEGSVSNVVGLPLPLTDRLCAQIDIDLLAFREPRRTP